MSYFVELHKSNETPSFGFNIKGGVDFGNPVYIWRVEPGSIAETFGIRSGDEILSANDIDFTNILHSDALKVLKNKQMLKLEVRQENCLPTRAYTNDNLPISANLNPNSSIAGSAGVAYPHYYTWVDRHGNICDPPPPSPHLGSMSTDYSTRRNSRVIDLLIEPGQNLGLMIRGGGEYGLGIYVTGVDTGSVAERAGLERGDEILSVNNRNFSCLTHDKAVQILKSNRKMTMIVSYVGKIPAAPVEEEQRNVMLEHRNGISGTLLDIDDGTGLMVEDKLCTSSSSQMSVLQMVEEKARTLLTKSEHSRFTFYRLEYMQGFLAVETFVKILLELLNTSDKFTLLTEVRELVRTCDRLTFDDLIYGKLIINPHNTNLLDCNDMLYDNFNPMICQSPFQNSPIKNLQPNSMNNHPAIRYRVRVQKVKPLLGIAIEGGINTPHRLPRIINVNHDGCAFNSNLKPGQVILTVDGQKLDGLEHDQIARIISDSFNSTEKSTIDFIVVESRRSLDTETSPSAALKGNAGLIGGSATNDFLKATSIMGNNENNYITDFN